MTRRPDLATTLLLALLVSLALVLVPREAPASAPFPTRVHVTSTEFRLSMSRVVVPGGRVRVELVNLGGDPHDLKIHRVGGQAHVHDPRDASGRALDPRPCASP
ncbi:MAG TPA: hypothetical protein VJ744_08745, partial [Gaiellaceae bacterium]|nr:hypothetical protein [Gaiellaceae bacterium]